MTNLRAVLWTAEQIKTLQQYAEEHPTDVERILAGKDPCVGDVPGHVLNLQGGMRVVYSIEDGHPMGTVRHLSLSVSGAGNWPNPVAVLALGEELGFRPDLEDGVVWQEEKVEAINWVQKKVPDGD